MKICILTMVISIGMILHASAQLAQDTSIFKKCLYISGLDTLRYRIYYPIPYHSSECYPVVIFLHGAGERGTDNEKQLGLYAAPAAFIAAKVQTAHPCFVIVPQCPRNTMWALVPWCCLPYAMSAQPSTPVQLLWQLLQQMKTQYSLDAARFVIVGHSMGGLGAWDMAIRYAPAFAAAIILTAGYDTSKAPAIQNMPVWAFHSQNDEGVPYKGTLNIITKLRDLRKAAGLDTSIIKLTTYPGDNHLIQDRVFDTPEVMLWLWDTALAGKHGN